MTTAGFLGWKLTAGLGAMAAFDMFAMAPYTEMVLKGAALQSGKMAVKTASKEYSKTDDKDEK